MLRRWVSGGWWRWDGEGLQEAVVVVSIARLVYLHGGVRWLPEGGEDEHGPRAVWHVRFASLRGMRESMSMSRVRCEFRLSKLPSSSRSLKQNGTTHDRDERGDGRAIDTSVRDAGHESTCRCLRGGQAARHHRMEGKCLGLRFRRMRPGRLCRKRHVGGTI